MANHIEGGPPRNQSEKWAIEFLRKNLPDHYLLISNIDITDSHGKRLEVDALLIGEWAVYVLEFKGYTGTVRAGEHVWDLGNGMHERSPLESTAYKSRVLAGRLRGRITGSMHVPWCQATVFVTGAGGEHIDLKRDRNAGSVHDPSDILDALTTTEGLTAHHHHRLTPQQRDFVLRMLGEVGRLSEVSNRLQGFDLGDVLLKSGAVTVQRATFRHGEFEREFLLRILDRTAFRNADECAARCQRLADEFRLYQELSDVAGVPYAAPLIDDGEMLALPIGIPDGRQLIDLDPEKFDVKRRLSLLASVAGVVQGIHRRGVVHGALEPTSIFVSGDDEVMLLDFSVGQIDIGESSAPELHNGKPPTAESDIYSLALIFCQWFAAPGEADFRLSEQFADGPEGLEEWFLAALDRDPEARPDLAALIRSLRQAEMGGSAIQGERHAPFEFEEGAILHDSYQLEASLGEGAAGAVWKAVHRRGRYPLALYFADAGGEREAQLRSRFAEIAALHHPMINRAFDMRRVPGHDLMYTAVEWFDGDVLDEMLEASQRPPIERSIAWFRDLLTALEHAHVMGVTHRNISPDAIVIVDNRPRLVEFSLLPDSARKTGLLQYTPPMVEAEGWRPESDLYSLAATFVHLWSGITPRSATGEARDRAEIEAALPSGLLTSLRKGLLKVLADDFELEGTNYLALFGLEDLAEPLTRLPEAFRKKWGISAGHQDRVTLFLLKEFHGNPKAKARQRSRVVAGSLALLPDVNANKSLRTAANSAISALIGKRVVAKPRKRSGPVRPTSEFLESWAAYGHEQE